MALDLAGYFGRINDRGAAEPNLEVLQGLVTAHTQSIRAGGTSRDGEADASKANRPLDQMIACSCKSAIRAAS